MTARKAKPVRLELANLLLTWYRTAPESRRLNVSFRPDPVIERSWASPAPNQVHMSIAGGQLGSVEIWPRASVATAELAEQIMIAQSRLRASYAFMEEFIDQRLDGGFMPGTPLALTDIRMPHLRPVDGRGPKPPSLREPGADFSFSAPRHGIGMTTFILPPGRAPQLRLASAWPLNKNEPARGRFWSDHTLGAADIERVLAPLWLETPKAIFHTRVAMRQKSGLFVELARGILRELGAQ